MFSAEAYKLFKASIEPIVSDCFVKKATKEEFEQNKYFITKGLWEGTENGHYVYYVDKAEAHRQELVEICKKFPDVQNPHNNQRTILCFDLIGDFQKYEIAREDMFAQVNLSNHFSNLLLATKMAVPKQIALPNGKAYYLILDNQYF